MKIDTTKLGIALAKRSMNQRNLSQASGVSSTTLSAIKAGKTCTPITLIKISSALGVEPEDIIEKEV